MLALLPIQIHSQGCQISDQVSVVIPGKVKDDISALKTINKTQARRVEGEASMGSLLLEIPTETIIISNCKHTSLRRVSNCTAEARKLPVH